jgi:hypothetical protein
LNRGSQLRATFLCALTALGALISPIAANAQTPFQLWASGTITWLTSDRMHMRVVVQSRDQSTPDDQTKFFSISTTPRFLYVVAPWIDALGEINFTRKDQSNDVDTITVSPRIGVQLHILSRLLYGGGGGVARSREAEPRQRFDFRTLVRLEEQRQSTNTDSSTTSSWTFRDRWTVAYPLNRPKTTSDGAVYLITDIEGFVPLDGGFVNELRLRTGPGYRPSFPWKFEWLYVWDGQRSRPSESLSTKYNAFYFRVYYQF